MSLPPGQGFTIDHGKDAVIKFSQKKKYLLFPVQESAPQVVVRRDTESGHLDNDVRLALKEVSYVVPLILTDEIKSVTIYDAPPKDAVFWGKLALSDEYSTANTDKYRPKYHFTPQWGWMNDPNGLFYFGGRYHVYFQYNPYASIWGNMTWGHASTADFVTWEHHPHAILPDDLGMIFSGSAVVDTENTSGWGKDCIVAMYTSHFYKGEILQRQCVAYSTDGGMTFTKYEGNPVIDEGLADFRDPKITRYKDKWICTVIDGTQAKFYSSKDLKNWKKEGVFGKIYGSHEGIWECPELIQIGDKWVLIISINPTCRMQYFVGNFDGHTFHCDEPPEACNWIDFGRDHYAGVSFNNSDKVFLVWMSNWDYSQQVPSKQFRSAMTIPRKLKLIDIKGKKRLVADPLPEFDALFKKKVDSLQQSCRMTLKLTEVSAEKVFIKVHNSNGEFITYELDRIEEYFNCIRTKAQGKIEFSDKFPCERTAPLAKSDKYEFKFFFDSHSCEVFDVNSTFQLSTTFFPDKPYDQIDIKFVNGSGKSEMVFHTL